MDNISGAEIRNSSSSIFLPSEPPNIRNWFPSYQYESFVLDTYDPIGGSVFQESDLGEDRLDVAGDKIREKEGNTEIDVNHDERSLNKMPDSTCLHSVLSEPPQIKNWFSSYVYESPALNTEDDFEGSISTESVCEKALSRGKSEGSLDENNELDVVEEVLRSNKLVKCGNSSENIFTNMPASEIHDSSQAPSSLSEPPDISNCFSSYVYKSPESSGFADEETEDCTVNQHKREKKRNSWELGQTRITTKVVIDEKVNSNGVLKFKSSSRDDDDDDDDEQESPSINRQQKQNFSKDRVLKRKSILNKDLSENSETKAQREAKLPPAGSRDSEKKSSGIVGKENEVSGNGFVTTKNRPKLNNENSFSTPKSGLRKCLKKEGTTASNCGKQEMGRRVLSERSNLEEAEGIGITGKWQCPQNKKLKLGPPLKQLRLERWINKL